MICYRLPMNFKVSS